MDHWDAITAERLALADVLATLTPAQWTTPSLCAAWDVHGLVAHLTVPLTVTNTEAVASLLRARGSIAEMAIRMAERRASQSPDELVTLLREHADRQFAPPVLGSVAPFADLMVHGQDLLIPLGLRDDRPVERWRPVLDFLMTPLALGAFLGAWKPSLRYVATDLDWSHGKGPVVEAPSAVLALALMRRTPRLDELSGPGADALRSWASA